jgi:hypothetical protein
MIVSDSVNRKATTLSPLATILVFLVPYCLGRLFLRSERDLLAALRPVAYVLPVAAALMVFEYVAGINLIWIVSGVPYTAGGRQGLTRARGFLGHPILTGLALVLIFPMALTAARYARERLAPAWWRLAPWATAAAIWATISRGPLLAFIGTFTIYQFFRRPMLRVPIVLLWAAVAAAQTFAPQAINAALISFSGESEDEDENGRVIELNGKEYIYNGTSHRWMLYMVYDEAMRRAGILGLGRTPFGGYISLIDDPNVPSRWFSSVDNNYIVNQIQYGLLGHYLFVASALLPVLPLARVAWSHRGPLGTFAAALVGAIVSLLLILYTVAMTIDLRFFWFSSLGMAVSIAQIARHQARRPPATRIAPPRALPQRPGPRPAARPVPPPGPPAPRVLSQGDRYPK